MDLPPRLVHDHRPFQTAVRSQGERRTCATFAATAAHEWMCGDRPDLSEEDALWAAKQLDETPGREETWVHHALGGMNAYGQAYSRDWPYGQPRFTAPRPIAASDPSRRRWASATREVGARSVADIAEFLVSGLATVLTLRFLPATWAEATIDGWIDDPNNPVVGSHAVLAVGARPAASERPSAVIFKNSWSENWGERGYGYLSDRYLNAHHQLTDVLEPSS